MSTVVIGIGGNLISRFGSAVSTVQEAISRLDEDENLSVLKVSPLYKSRPMPVSDQPDYINAAVLVETELNPGQLLAFLQYMELEMGRMPSDRWGSRIIDLDILAYDLAVLPNQKSWDDITHTMDPREVVIEAVVPHPRLHERAFASVPFAKIAPKWRHPVFGTTISEIAGNLAKTQELVEIV